MKSVSTWGRVLKNAAVGWSNDRCSTGGAALSYYTLFSLAPLLLISFAIAGLALGNAAGRAGVLAQVRTTVGAKTASAIESIVENADQVGGTTLTLFSIVTLIAGASGVFVELQDSLNLIWKTSKKAPGGIWGFIRARLLSVGAVIGVGFLLLVSLILSAVLQALGRTITPASLPGGAWLWEGLHLAINFGLIAVLLALTYKFLPNAPVAWRDVWGGAILTAGLFLLGKFLLSFYIAHVGIDSMYGAAGSVVVILVWVYYSAQILLFGAEVTHAYAREAGSLHGVKEEEECPSDGTAQVLAKEQKLAGTERQ